MVGEFFLQEGNQGLCRRCPREAMGNDGPFPMIGEELLDGFSDSVGIIGVEIGGSIATDLTQHWDIGH